jgi:hypothetical protein
MAPKSGHGHPPSLGNFARFQRKDSGLSHFSRVESVHHTSCVYDGNIYCLFEWPPEGFLLYLEGLNCHWRVEVEDHFIIALQGKIKGEHNVWCHLLPYLPVAGTESRIKESVKQLMDLKATQGLMDGHAISKENGHLFLSRAIDELMLEVLEELFVSNQDIFPTKTETIQDLQKAYQVFRTLQRTSDTQALEMRVIKDDIDVL